MKKNPREEVRRSKYIGKRVKGVRYSSHGTPGRLIEGVCESAYYTINTNYQTWKNIHYRVRTLDGRLLSFNTLIII